MVRTQPREMRAGAGDALAKAFEMIATPAVFGLGAWYLDGQLGTFPAVTLPVVLVVFSYQVWRFARDYSQVMDEALEERRERYGISETAGSKS